RMFASVYSWPQKTRVSEGSAASFESDDHISAGVPSNNRPQPTANNVSPQKTAGALESDPTNAMCPAVCPGISNTSNVTSMPGTSMRSPSPSAFVRPGIVSREQAYFDRTVADIFGFHALQIGLPECSFLAQSRIVSRWTLDYDVPATLIADPHGLPFAENALDLIVMPHALEFTDNPHLMLREAYRVIRPEGQIVIAGFNPFSLFGAKRYFGRAQSPPWDGNFIALYRLK